MTEEVPLSLLLASSVHDIKNSLGMLLNTLEDVIAAAPLQQDDPQRRRFATLQGEAARINNALISLLGLYRLQQRQLPVRLQEVFVADFLDEQIEANRLLFETRGLQVDLICDAQLCAYFDPTLVAGVIGNVLVNGAHYAREHIAVGASVQADGLWIEVRDDGAGFPEKMLHSVRNRDRGIDFGSGSTNLGLFFAGEIARLHQRGAAAGRVELHNPDGGGGLFRLFLP